MSLAHLGKYQEVFAEAPNPGIQAAVVILQVATDAMFAKVASRRQHKGLQAYAKGTIFVEIVEFLCISHR